MEGKHSPGEWAWDRRSLVSRQEYRPGYVAEVMICQCEYDEMPSKADAQLITAAPKLLEACTLAEKYFSAMIAGPETHYPELTALRAAIAKARDIK